MNPRTPNPDQDADEQELEALLAGEDPIHLEAAAWVARHRNGLSKDEEGVLNAWLSADPRHAAAFETLSVTFDRVRRMPGDQIEGLKAGVRQARMRTKPVPDARSNDSMIQLHVRPRRTWVAGLLPHAVAAAFLLLLVAGGWMGWMHWQGQPVFEKVYVTERGEQMIVNLPDSSIITLDTATRAEIRLYRKRREVRLTEGQVLFAVQADSARPFQVLAGVMRVTVVGTRFSVRYTSTGVGAGNVAVQVEEGRVRVARIGNDAGPDVPEQDAIELAAGQAAVADAAGRMSTPTRLTPGTLATWREGRISFNDTPLAQALAEFERYGYTGVVVRDPHVAAMAVGGSYSLREFQRFADTLPQVLPVRLERRNGVTEVVRLPPENFSNDSFRGPEVSEGVMRLPR